MKNIMSEKKSSVTSDLLKTNQRWEGDRLALYKSSERRAWMVAAIATVTAGAGFGVAAYQLFRDPPPPSVIEVEKLTGRVQLLTSLTNEKLTLDQASDEHWCQMYLIFRLSYSPDTREMFYRYVGFFSGPQETTKYSLWFSPENPQSPLNIYKDKKVRIKINSVSPLEKGKSMLIRFTKEIVSNTAVEEEHWQVIMTYKYSPEAKMTKEARGVNPFAFQVLSFEESPDGSTNYKSTEKAGKK